MTTPAAVRTDCLYCQIAAGHRPAEIVFESGSAIAFLERHPVATGHTLIIPRRHAPTLLDLDEGAAGGLLAAVVEVLDQLRSTLSPLGFNVGWNHGAAAGQRVPHLHVHILPRFRVGGRGVQALGEGVQGVDLAELGDTIRAAPGRGQITPRARLVPGPLGRGDGSGPAGRPASPSRK